MEMSGRTTHLLLFILVLAISSVESEWSEFRFQGDAPRARFGHCMVTVPSRFYKTISSSGATSNLQLLTTDDDGDAKGQLKKEQLVNSNYELYIANNLRGLKSFILDTPTPTTSDDSMSLNNNSYWVYGGAYSYSPSSLVTPPVLLIKDRSSYYREVSFGSITSNPGARWGHSCQLVGSSSIDNSTQILVFGGDLSTGFTQFSGDLWLYSMTADSWTLLSSYYPPTPPPANNTIVDSTGSLEPSNSTDITGTLGSSNSTSDIGSLESSNSTKQNETIVSVPPTVVPEILPYPRTLFGSATNTTHLFIFGGLANVSVTLSNGSRSDSQVQVVDDFWVYNTVNPSWTLLDKNGTGDYPPPLYGHSMVIAQECVYLFGGFKRSGETASAFYRLYKYDISGRLWSIVYTDEDSDDAPSARGFHSMVLDSKKETAFFVYGGKDADGDDLSDLWIFDLDSESWEAIETSFTPPALSNTAMSLSSDVNGFLLYGGDGVVDPGLFYTYGLDCNCNGRGGCFYGVCSCFSGYFGEYCESSIDGPILLGLGLAVSVPILCFGWCVLRCTTLPTRLKILTLIIIVMSCSLFVSVESCLSCWLPEALMGMVAGGIGLVGILKYKSPKVILYFTLSVFCTIGVGGYGLILFVTICMMGNCRNDKPTQLWLPKYAIIMSFVHLAVLILVLPLSFKLYKHRKYMNRISNNSGGNAINGAFLFSNNFQPPQEPVNTLLKKLNEDNNNNNNNDAKETTTLSELNQKALNYLQKEFNLRNELNKLRLSKSMGSNGSPLEDIKVRVDRATILDDTYRQLVEMSPARLLQNISVKFVEEEGIDMGGLKKEWFSLLFKHIFDPQYGLFVLNSNYTLSISPYSHLQTDYLSYFSFAGRMVARAVVEGVHLDHTFSRTIYKLILNKPPCLDDLIYVDPAFHKSLLWVLENSVDEMEEVTFSTTVDQPGVGLVLVDLKPGGRDILVNEENKLEFVHLMTQWRFQRDISDQAYHFIRGFRDLIPLELLSNFTECELELFICGLIEIDVEDWKANTNYRGFTPLSNVIEWFWEIVEEMEIEDRIRLLQFVTGNARLPPSGFQGLMSAEGNVKFQIHKSYSSDNQLPIARTCFNRLDLPNYESKEKLKNNLLISIKEGLPGFYLS